MDATTEFCVLLAALLAVVVLCVKPLGSYVAAVMQGAPVQGRRNFALRSGGRFEALLYRLSGIDPAEEMSWPGTRLQCCFSTCWARSSFMGCSGCSFFYRSIRKSSRR